MPAQQRLHSGHAAAGKVDHDRFAFLVALFVLPTLGAASHRDRTPDPRTGWAVRCIQVAVVATYLLAVVAKARYGHGLDTWLDSTTLLRAVVRRGTFLADPLTRQPWILHATQYLVVANADRTLPYADASFAAVASITAA